MTRKIAFSEGRSWFKFNNLGLVLGTNLEFCTSVAKGLKLKVRKFWGPNATFVEVTGEKLVGFPPTPPPPLILNRVNDVIKEETKKHNPNWPEIPDHPYRMLIIEDPGSKKTNPLFNLTNWHSDIDKIYLYVKNPHEAKYQFENRHTILTDKQQKYQHYHLEKFLNMNIIQVT